MTQIVFTLALIFIVYVIGYTSGRMNILNEFKNIIDKLENNRDEK